MPEQLLNEDAEFAVLNILISNPDLVYSVPYLRDFMFSNGANQQVYSTIAEISEQGSVPEYPLLLAYLESKGKLGDVGGKEYLDYIKNLTFNKENLKEFERQVKESYRFRTATAILASATRKLTASAYEVDLIINDLKKDIDSIEDTAGGDQIVDLYSASSDMWNELVTRIDNPGLKGIATGFSDLDMQTGGYGETDVWVVASRPSMGKSTEMINSALAVAKSGVPVLIFSLEMSKVQLVERMIACDTGVPLFNIRMGTLNQDELNRVQEGIKRIKSLPIYIDTNYGANENYFVSVVRKYKKLKGIRVVFLDYIQLACARDADQTAELGRFSRASKLLAKEINITIVIFSQLNRGVESREDKRPILSDLRQSGNIEEDADIVIMLYRDEIYNKNTKDKNVIEFIIRKHRNGPTGTLPFTFNGDTTSISAYKRK